MQFLSLWIKILIVLGFGFFVFWAYMCDLWTERDPRKFKTIMGGVMVSWIYFFKVFLLATLIFSVIYIVANNII